MSLSTPPGMRPSLQTGPSRIRTSRGGGSRARRAALRQDGPAEVGEGSGAPPRALRMHMLRTMHHVSVTDQVGSADGDVLRGRVWYGVEDLHLLEDRRLA